MKTALTLIAILAAFAATGTIDHQTGASLAADRAPFTIAGDQP